MKKIILLIGVAAISIGAKKKDPNALPVAQAMTAKDKSDGAKAHPEILNEFGGAYEGPQATYVRTVGQKIAMQSGLSNTQGDFTVTLINSPVNNAFAIPGGYIYTTRQLLALMNNEAELASVLGHEVGHVVARHSAKRQSRATKGGLLAAGLTIAGAVLGGGQGAELGQQLGSTIATRYVMKYSRAQEYESDDLGVSYLAKSGYDPLASSTMLASLAAQTSLDARIQGQQEQKMPQWASSHPDPASRVARAAQKAGIAASTGKNLNRDAFLASLDGIIYDDDPKQGVVEGQTFKHPDLKMTFTAPSGFALNNTPQAVQFAGTGGKGQFSGGAYKGDLNAFVGEVFKGLGNEQNQLNYGSVSKTTVNGLSAAYASATVTNQSGQQVLVTVYGYEFAADQAFYVLGIMPGNAPSTFNSLFQSVRRLTAQEAAAIKPRKIDVVTVKSGDTIEKISSRMAYGSYQQERFTVLNALKPGAALQSGQKVKIVVYAQ